MPDHLHPDELRDQFNNPNALDANPLSLLTAEDWAALALTAAFLAGLVFVTAMWLFSDSPDRPAGCEAYRGGEVAACVAEARL